MLSREELVELFTLEGINRANAVVNFTEDNPFDAKALWLNADFIRAMPRCSWRGRCCLRPGELERMRKITPLIRERMKLLRDVADSRRFLLRGTVPPYDAAELIPKKGDAAMAKRVLERAREVLARPSSRTMGWRPRCEPLPKDSASKPGQMFEPIRVAVCGSKTAPPLFGHA